MVYECPQCKTPLPPGASSCARCGLQFATPIPADATLPGPGTAAYEETTGYDGAPGTEGKPSQRVVAVVAALCVVLVLIAAFAVYTFSRTPVATPAIVTTPGAPPPSASAVETGVSTPASTAAGSSGSIAPVTLPSGTSSGPAAQNNSGLLVGHWQAKNQDFYVFNADGTGSHGSASGGHKSESFTWVVDENEIVLNSRSSSRVHFSAGSDASSIYIGASGGRYELFQRIGTS